jgi:hypothetical protein
MQRPAEYVDQVERLRSFQAGHPDIEVRHPDYPRGALLWSAHRDGLVLCCESELKALLDRCEALLARPESAPASC